MWLAPPVSDSFTALKECRVLTSLRTLSILTRHAAAKAERRVFSSTLPTGDQFSAPPLGLS